MLYSYILFSIITIFYFGQCHRSYCVLSSLIEMGTKSWAYATEQIVKQAAGNKSMIEIMKKATQDIAQSHGLEVAHVVEQTFLKHMPQTTISQAWMHNMKKELKSKLTQHVYSIIKPTLHKHFLQMLAIGRVKETKHVDQSE